VAGGADILFMRHTGEGRMAGIVIEGKRLITRWLPM
jgi:hypothetical protein